MVGTVERLHLGFYGKRSLYHNKRFPVDFHLPIFLQVAIGQVASTGLVTLSYVQKVSEKISVMGGW